MTDREAQCPTKEGCWTSDKEKELDNLKDQLDKLQQAMVTLLTANKDKKDETSKLQERIQQVQRDFEKKANACDRLSIEMCEKKEEISHLLQEKERVMQITERLKEKEKNDKLLQEHIGKLRNELQEKEDKVEDLSQKLDEGTKDIKRLNNSLQTNEQERVKREKMINNYIDTMNKELEILRENIKEKDSNISQLVKVTDQKLAYCYPDKPAKIGERWASLYTDEWTDVYEDMTQQNKEKGNTYELPEKQLIKIVDWCYKKCLEISKEQNYEIQETLWEVVRLIHNLRVKPEKLKNKKGNHENYDVRDTILIESMEPFQENAKFQLNYSMTLIDAVKKKCWEDYISFNPDVLSSAKYFVLKCSELCWHVLSSNPPMAIDYEDLHDQAMNPNKFNKYTRSGTTVEYVVWPALLLHKDGPVLAKGTAQTNYEDKTVPGKKSSDVVFATQKTCKPSSTPTVKDDITSNEIFDPVLCKKDVLKCESVSDQLIVCNFEVRTKGSREVKSETNNSTKGAKYIGDDIEETNTNGVRNEFVNSSNEVTQLKCKAKNQYKNISITKSPTTRDKPDMTYDELNVLVYKGIPSQNEGRDTVYSKPQNHEYEPGTLSLDPTTYIWESNTDDKYEPLGYNKTGNKNDEIPVSNIESKIKWYSKEGNQLNGPTQRMGTIQRELDKVRKRSKLPKEKDFYKTKPESKTSRKSSSN